MPFNGIQSDHLFLLMGENALPNAIAILSLLKLGGIPYLIHTRRTVTQAHYLAQVLHDLSMFQPAQFIDLKDSQAEASVIRQQIQAVATTLSGQVGMNYTGGTKVMAVHAYRAIEACRPQAIFSYLDSNTLEMMIDQDEAASMRVRVASDLTLEQLFRLHGLSWRTDHPPSRRPIQAEAASKLAHVHQYPGLAQAWRGWCNRVLRSQAKNQYGRWRSEDELRRLPPLPLDDLPDVIRAEVLQEHLGAGNQDLSLVTAQHQGFRSVTQVCEWLDGVWLEHDVLRHIQRIAESCQIHDYGLGFRVQDPMKGRRPWDKFEFDVAFMHHYQLFALSCTTTASRGLCKQKLFEASVRARQLGGAEARVALVCFHDNPASLRSELEVTTRNKKIAVFGRSDVRDLGKKITEWVKWNG